MDRVMAGARSVIGKVCRTQPGERVLVITDTGRPDAVGRSLFDAAVEAGAEPLLAIIEPPAPGTSYLPEALAAAVAQADVILGPSSGTIYYTHAIQKACRQDKTARFVAITESTETTIASPGMNVDFERTKPVLDAVKAQFEVGDEVTITTPAGTDIRARMGGRQAYAVYGQCWNPGDMSAIPNLEVWVSPVEDSINGKVVADASVSGGIGCIDGPPIILTVKDGRVTAIEGGTQADEFRKTLDDADHPGMFQIAEIGLGLNPGCRITGSIIEDEGVYKTVHLAVGSNVLIGGQNEAPLHLDLVQWNPTLHIDGAPVSVDGLLANPEHAAVLEAEGRSVNSA